MSDIFRPNFQYFMQWNQVSYTQHYAETPLTKVVLWNLVQHEKKASYSPSFPGMWENGNTFWKLKKNMQNLLINCRIRIPVYKLPGSAFTDSAMETWWKLVCVRLMNPILQYLVCLSRINLGVITCWSLFDKSYELKHKEHLICGIWLW